MKKGDFFKQPEVVALQKQLDSQLRQKVYLANLEGKLILEDAKAQLAKVVELRKQDIQRLVEERVHESEIETKVRSAQWRSALRGGASQILGLLCKTMPERMRLTRKPAIKKDSER